MSDKICVIGLGYVGLPLAVEFSKFYNTIGFDISKSRILELKEHHDRTKELSYDQLASSRLMATDQISDIMSCNIYIVTVPTPIDQYNRPDLSPLLSATRMIAKVLKKNDIVIYESTVYPGCTEEDCVPVLESISGLKYNQDFFCGYSPERMNPGDKERTVSKIVKVTSGSTPDVAKKVNSLYSTIVAAGTFMASSIKVAEAAKVIENTQRDINIAFMNELSIIFSKMNLDTKEVLDAASTKWNFLKFTPGLVGGHCIGVDPYYLTHKSESLGYHPQVILAGRRINDSMGAYVASSLIKLLVKRNYKINSSKILVLGLTFKENCPDVRNSKVVDIVKELQEYGCEISAYDPWASPEDVKHEFGIEMSHQSCLDNLTNYTAIIVAVAHKQFHEIEFNKLKHDHGVVLFDVKSMLDKNDSDGRL
jgi:UDP-N-acetyl-D-glucosamine/UDP-N-acetyl-D-galactosamine dehydrogenase